MNDIDSHQVAVLLAVMLHLMKEEDTMTARLNASYLAKYSEAQAWASRAKNKAKEEIREVGAYGEWPYNDLLNLACNSVEDTYT